MAWKECISDKQATSPEAEPLDDPWFWPDGIQPPDEKEPNELEPFWR